MAAAPEQLRWLLLALWLPLAATAMQPFESRELSAPAGAQSLRDQTQDTIARGAGSHAPVGAQSLRDTTSLVGAQSLRDTATLVIIIDDLGNRLAEGEATINLPGRLSVAVLPHTAHGEHLARAAHRVGKEVLLHAPMSTLDQRHPGPGALTGELTEAEFRDTLARALADVPHVAGVNNHMGSELTGQRKQMQWLMLLLAEQGLYFVDSRTNKDTVAADVAAELGLPHLSRQVFLDNVPSREAIAEQFAVLIERARRDGLGIAIGHPYPETIAYLQEVLPTLEGQGLRLATVSEALAAGSPQ
ncbi:MAG: divergent polysaccharide deacetylase family protein [Haliea sp.]